MMHPFLINHSLINNEVRANDEVKVNDAIVKTIFESLAKAPCTLDTLTDNAGVRRVYVSDELKVLMADGRVTRRVEKGLLTAWWYVYEAV